MNEATRTIREQLFIPEHLSYYTTNDIDILDECRSVPPSGLLSKLRVDANMLDTDVSKAYTSELHNIDKIQIFTQFGTWNDYDNLTIEDYTSYTVYSNNKCDIK
jgi:ABC-type lipoprotein release transport system permease subunit